MNMLKINAVYENVLNFIFEIKRHDVAISNGVYNLYITHDNRYKKEIPIIIDIYDKKDNFIKQLYSPTAEQLHHIYNNYYGIYDSNKKRFYDFIL